MALTDVKSEQIQSSVALAGSPTTTTQSASDNSTKIATTAYVETAVANLVASAPSALNTLDELAAALNDDASFSTTVTNSIATKLPLAGGTMSGALNMGSQNITNAGTIAGTLATAAQTNITSLGTLTGLTSSGNITISTSSGGGGYLILDNTATGGRDYRIISTNNAHGSLGGGDFAILDNDVSGNDAAKTRLLIDSSGNVGIGTTSPTTSLDLVHQISTTGIEYPVLIAGIDVGNTQNQDTGSGIGLQFKLAGNDSSGDSLVGAGIVAMRESGTDADSSTALAFQISQNDTTLDEAMRIDSSGRVLIGQDSGDSFNADSMLRLQRASDRVFMQFKTDGNNNSAILFGDVDDDVECKIEYEPSNTGGSLTFSSGNNSEAIRIDTDRNVGIAGTPDRRLHVFGASNKGIQLKVGAQIAYAPSSSDFYNGFTLQNSGSGHAFSIGYGQGARLKFSYFDNSSTYEELATMRPGGDFYPTGSVVMPNGEGINFSATANGTGTANRSELLDDYEEGTFNAVIYAENGSITVDSSDNLCFYTKIGRLVTVSGRISVSSVSNPSGQLDVGNLPFNLASAGETSHAGAVTVNIYNAATNFGGEVVGEMRTTGGGRILIRGNGGTTASVHSAAANIDSGSLIGFTATYPST